MSDLSKSKYLREGKDTPAAATLASKADPKTKPFLLLGDTSHVDQNVLGFLAEPGTMQALADKGYKNLFLEHRVEFQELTDQVAEGKVKTFEEYMKAKDEIFKKEGVQSAMPPERARMEFEVIKSAGAHGMHVYCAEHEAGSLKEHMQLVALNEKEHTALHEATVAAQKSGDADPQLSMKDPAVAKASDNYMRDIRSKRADGDRDLANFIEEKSGGAPSVVFYGSAHGSMKHDLHESLPGAQRIALYSTKEAMESGASNTHFEKRDISDALVIDTGKYTTAAHLKGMVAGEPQMPEAHTPDALRAAEKPQPPSAPSRPAHAPAQHPHANQPEKEPSHAEAGHSKSPVMHALETLGIGKDKIIATKRELTAQGHHLVEGVPKNERLIATTVLMKELGLKNKGEAISLMVTAQNTLAAALHKKSAPAASAAKPAASATHAPG